MIHISDRSLRFLFEVILLNDRLKYYEMYIKYALRHGYMLTSYIDYLKNLSVRKERVIVLRHDIDYPTMSTRSMFDIEKRNGVKAAYYFRWSTFDRDLINEMHKDGFEVGLHYETLGKYCDDNDLKMVDKSAIDTCRKNLKDEIEDFNNMTGLRIDTVSAHGHPKNKELNISNNVLLEGEDYAQYGLVSEAYDRFFYEGQAPVHISDCHILYNYGFIYDSNLIDSINDGKSLIVFLTHPSHWRYDIYVRLKMLIKIILGRYVKSSDKKFKRISGEY